MFLSKKTKTKINSESSDLNITKDTLNKEETTQKVSKINKTKKTKKEKPKKKGLRFSKYYLLSFLIPVFVMLTVFISIGVFPFGEKSLLTIDLYHQYIDFFSYLRKVLLGEGNILYSFSKGLGGNMIGLFAYYLASPLNLIFILFGQSFMSEAILALTLVKVGLCGLSFAYMLKKIYRKKTLFNLIFSSCYALMSYNFVFAQNIMWLDAVIWLPMVVLGIYTLIEKDKFLTYTLSLTMAVLSNYYVGYMICIFCVLYFIYEMFVHKHNELTKKIIIKKFWKFVGASLLAAGLAAILLLPTFMSLQNGKAEFNPEIFTMAENFDIALLFQKLYIGEMNIELLHQGLNTTLPDFFCGTITTLLCMLYFPNRNISVKEKMCSLIMFVVLVLSWHIKSFDLIWHGFNTPVGFLYRNSFIFSFFSLYIAYRCFINYRGIKPKHVLYASLTFIAISVFTDKFALDSLTSAEIYMTIGFFIAYSILIALILYGKKRHVVFLMIFALFALEFEIFGVLTLENLSHVNRDTYVEGVTTTKEIADKIKNMDDSFYRMDKTFYRSSNDGMQHSYNTISHSSSTADYPAVAFLNKMGFKSDSDICNTYDYGSTLIANSLLNIKYIADDKNTYFKYYKELNQTDKAKIYQNPYALPLMFKGNNSVAGLQTEYDSLAFQNSIYTALANTENDVLEKITPSNVKTHNLYTESNGTGTKYVKEDSSSTAYIEFTLRAINSEEIYAYLPTEPISESTVEVYVNDVYLRNHLDSDHLTYYDILNLGYHNAGDTVNVRLVLQDTETNFDEAFFYALNLDNFKSAYETLASGSIEYTFKSDSKIVANVNDLKSNELVFTTIPYDKGWSIYVDGKKTEPVVIFDALIGLQLEPGSHKIVFKYTPPGLKLGALISLSSLVFIMLYVLSKKAQKRRFKRKLEREIKRQELNNQAVENSNATKDVNPKEEVPQEQVEEPAKEPIEEVIEEPVVEEVTTTSPIEEETETVSPALSEEIETTEEIVEEEIESDETSQDEQIEEVSNNEIEEVEDTPIDEESISNAATIDELFTMIENLKKQY